MPIKCKDSFSFKGILFSAFMLLSGADAFSLVPFRHIADEVRYPNLPKVILNIANNNLRKCIEF